MKTENFTQLKAGFKEERRPDTSEDPERVSGPVRVTLMVEAVTVHRRDWRHMCVSVPNYSYVSLACT